MTSLQITPQTIVADLLNAYPKLEDKLIELAPVFKKLQNPVLRRTIAKVTTLKQASVVSNIDLGYLVNELRKSAGFENIISEELKTENVKEEKQTLLNNLIITLTYDARNDLENGIHPMTKVMKEVSELKAGDVYLLITPFIPAPLIDILMQKGYNVKYSDAKAGIVETFISLNIK